MDDSKLAAVHPGDILFRDFMKPLDLTPDALSNAIGVQSARVASVVRRACSVTAELAMQLGEYFGTTARFWMNLQEQYDSEVLNRLDGRGVTAEVAPPGTIRANTSDALYLVPVNLGNEGVSKVGRIPVAKQRFLKNAPITEALISFELPEGAEFEVHEKRFLSALEPGYYRKGDINLGTFELQSDPTAPVKSHAARVGSRLHSMDEKYVLQITRTNFTLSRLEPYEGWEGLRKEAQRLWREYVAIATPQLITQVVVRYINSIRIDISKSVELGTVFERPPMEPKDMPDAVSSFLTRVTVEDPSTQASAVVTLVSQPAFNQTMPVVLDIEVVRKQEFTVANMATVWEYLETLRSLKNTAFFGSLTEERIRLYE